MAQAQAQQPTLGTGPVAASAAEGAQQDDIVASPSLSSSTALARFEFESGRNNDGTKILMVEWEDDEQTRNVQGEWHLTWKDRESVLSARDQQNSDIHRVYFLLPPHTAVPTQVTLTFNPSSSTALEPVVWTTNPLPAIFPPELGSFAQASGKKGVLHTIYAKSRLAALRREIESEERTNPEGIGLEMALQEKEWLETNFGVVSKPSNISIPAHSGSMAAAMPPLSPTTPRSPGGGRLLEKLKGLRLGTNEKELAGGQQQLQQPPQSLDTPPQTAFLNPLSPDMADVAVSSFAAFKGAGREPAVSAPKPVQPTPPPARKMVAQSPPSEVLAWQQRVPGEVASLGGILQKKDAPAGQHEEDGSNKDAGKDDDLFALPISPRSPDMAKSPFSFAPQDTEAYRRSGSK